LPEYYGKGKSNVEEVEEVYKLFLKYAEEHHIDFTGLLNLPGFRKITVIKALENKAEDALKNFIDQLKTVHQASDTPVATTNEALLYGDLPKPTVQDNRGFQDNKGGSGTDNSSLKGPSVQGGKTNTLTGGPQSTNSSDNKSFLERHGAVKISLGVGGAAGLVALMMYMIKRELKNRQSDDSIEGNTDHN
jgi:hypothetical protein